MKGVSITEFSLRYFIGLVWLVNGLFCKVLDLVPRHREIVGEILGSEYAEGWTLAIGVGEILLAIWVFSGWRKKLAAGFQIAAVLTMNIIEWLLVRELLLWGSYNLLWAGIIVFLIWMWAFSTKTAG